MPAAMVVVVAVHTRSRHVDTSSTQQMVVGVVVVVDLRTARPPATPSSPRAPMAMVMMMAMATALVLSVPLRRGRMLQAWRAR